MSAGVRVSAYASVCVFCNSTLKSILLGTCLDEKKKRKFCVSLSRCPFISVNSQQALGETPVAVYESGGEWTLEIFGSKFDFTQGLGAEIEDDLRFFPFEKTAAEK